MSSDASKTTERQKETLHEVEELVRRILAKRGYDRPKAKDVRSAASKMVKAVPAKISKGVEPSDGHE